MIKLKNIKLNKKLLRDLGVGTTLIFGSYITGIKHPKSDIDIGIVFKDKRMKRENPVEVYGSLYEEFKKKFKFENIDIVYLEESPLSLQYKAVRNGIVLYEESPVFYADYKEKILKYYFDFKFFENIFKNAFLQKA